MAIDEDLNDRLRGLLGSRSGLAEKKMMGGLCFLLNGHMIGGADRTKDGERRFIFRVGKDNHDKASALPGAVPMVQGGRTMSGLFFVGEDEAPDDVLQSWLDLAVENALSLPPK
ncbi:TfoX/Sxy family protein [Labrenzia sp. VG12]|uniref:TfoX/Sxy family protein n=1 Tax=Labrenzia sp. VG12 TaxID=2021862 RepID=UPI000B8C2BCF|nr:TfoX/Sxy family protein [Labrenzia sp. VG12]ASP36827.1 RNA methyltransferase [Labrenzia sp. VG12]